MTGNRSAPLPDTETRVFRVKRGAERKSIKIPVTVAYHPEATVVVREMTHTVSVSPIGAGFCLKHSFEVGQLIELTLPLPSEMRKYPAPADQYRIWAVVRYCLPINIDGATANHIGVAFIGKEPPADHFRDPMSLFDLTRQREDGLWIAERSDRKASTRKQPRYAIPIDVGLVLCGPDGNIVGQERSVTENISTGGAAVFSALPLKNGDLVKFVADQYNLTLTAEVKNVRVGVDGLPRAHLKFTDGTFPLDGIERA